MATPPHVEEVADRNVQGFPVLIEDDVGAVDRLGVAGKEGGGNPGRVGHRVHGPLRFLQKAVEVIGQRDCLLVSFLVHILVGQIAQIKGQHPARCEDQDHDEDQDPVSGQEGLNR